MTDQAIKELVASASTFVGQTAPAVVKLQQGAGVVADLLFSIANLVDLSLNAIRVSPAFDDLTLLQTVSINAAQTAMSETKGGIVHIVAAQYQPDFSSIYALPTGGILPGFNLIAGDLADSPDIVMDWIASLKEASRNENYTDIISFTGQNAGQPYNIFTNSVSATPVMIMSDLDDKLVALAIAAKDDIATEADIRSVCGKIVDVLDAVSFDEDLIPDEKADEDLIKLEGIKAYKVLPDDTLQSIAYKELGSADRWREIAAINDIIIENPLQVYVPVASYSYPGDMAAGQKTMPYDGTWAQDSALEGNSKIKIVDSLGHTQQLVVKTMGEDEAVFHETFSQYFTGPITITRYDNRSHYGAYDTSTNLAAASVQMTRTLALTSAKDVYKGYILRISEGAASYFYTVSEVDYLTDTVKVEEWNIDHAVGRTVEIYDVYNRLYHLEPGTVLNIPKAAGNVDSGNIVQSYSEIFGTDFELDTEGFLTISDSDLNTITGLFNFKQAIKQRINCPYASLVFHPEYGCGLWAIVGEKNVPYYETLAKASIIDALGHEPRIDNIAKFNMETTADSIRFNITVNPVESNTPQDLNFVITGA